MGIGFILDYVNENLIDAPTQAIVSGVNTVKEGVATTTLGLGAVGIGAALIGLDAIGGTKGIGVESDLTDEIAYGLIEEGTKTAIKGGFLTALGTTTTGLALPGPVAAMNASAGMGMDAVTGVEDDTPLELLNVYAQDQLGVKSSLPGLGFAVADPLVGDLASRIGYELVSTTAEQRPPGEDDPGRDVDTDLGSRDAIERHSIDFSSDESYARSLFYINLEDIKRRNGYWDTEPPQSETDKFAIQAWNEAVTTVMSAKMSEGLTSSEISVGTMPSY